MKKTVKDGQTLADMAIQEFGSWEAMAEIARHNGMSMTDVTEAGTELSMPDASWNRMMQKYCRDNEVSPATARGQDVIQMRVFEEEFTEEFN